MTDNPLAKGGGPGSRGSVFTCAEWAAMAEDKGLPELAKQWRQAGRDGWDDRNYDPAAATEFKRKISEKRKSWGGR